MTTASGDNLLERLRDPAERPVCVGPMAGWTDAAYRKILRDLGARHLWVPFISTHAIDSQGSNRDIYLDEVAREKSHVQIFGSNPAICARAARELEERGALSIDFNAGCGVRKVHKAGGGSVLLKNLDLLTANLKAIIDAVAVPVSLKTRIGFTREGDESGIEACRRAANLGCAWVTLHARTARQGLDGPADWNAIAKLAGQLPIPVIGNGDIFTPRDALRMFDETGCAGVMIGRGIMGNPFLAPDCERYLTTGEPGPRRSRSELMKVILAHQQASLDHHGRTKGVLEFRKHIAKYLRGFAQAAKLRSVLVRLDDPEEITRILREFGEGRPPDQIVEHLQYPVH